MDQEPVEQTSGGADGKPKLFQNINGVIAGLTGLVVAVGGLIAAYTGLKPDKKPDEPVEQTALKPDEPAGQTAASGAVATTTPEEEGNPGLYTGDKSDGTVVKLEFDGDEWVLTEGRDNRYTYVEMLTSDPAIVKAFDKDTGYYLRWPVNGGALEESQDDDDYDPYANIKPSE